MDGQPQSIEPEITGKSRTQFRKGQSGNPRGRPKKTETEYQLEAEAKKKAKDALQTLVDAMEAEDAPWASRINAAQTILDRGYGKAGQVVDVNHNHSFDEMFHEIIGRLNDERRGIREAPTELVAIASDVCDSGAGGES